MNSPTPGSTAPTVDQLVGTLNAQARADRQRRSAKPPPPLAWLSPPPPTARVFLVLSLVLLLAVGPLCLWLVLAVRGFADAFAGRLAAERAAPPPPAIPAARLLDDAAFAADLRAHPRHHAALVAARIAALLAAGRADDARAEAATAERAEGVALPAALLLDLAERDLADGHAERARDRLAQAAGLAPAGADGQRLVRLAAAARGLP